MVALPIDPILGGATPQEIRYPVEDARAVAQALKDALAPECTRIEIGGSIRRNKITVKDIELIIESDQFMRITDDLITRGILEKRLVNTQGGILAPRWGERTRLARHVESGIPVDLFRADAHNWGWQFMLRTGSGEANAAIMTIAQKKNAPIRFDEGYVWAGADKLRIDSEETMFALLGIDFVEPERRNPRLYTTLLNRPGHAWGDPSPYIVQAEQIGLFGAVNAPGTRAIQGAPVVDAESALKGITGATGAADGTTAAAEAEREYNRWLMAEVMPNRHNPDWLERRALELEAQGVKLTAYCYQERARELRERC